MGGGGGAQKTFQIGLMEGGRKFLVKEQGCHAKDDLKAMKAFRLPGLTNLGNPFILTILNKE